jgi:sugar phosphate isomerase/epimerase
VSASALAAPSAQRTVAAQLYPVRKLLRKEPDRALKGLAAIGFKEVEGYNRPQLIGLAPRLKEYGLTPRACTVETPLITANWDPFPELKRITLQEAIDSLATAGVEYFVLGDIPPGARGDGEDFFRRTADRMNSAAELCRKSGLRFAWQNHDFEFAGRLGLRPIDIYKERLDQKLVSLELDVFWLSMAGVDPLKIMKEWKGHISLLRLNDRTQSADDRRGAYTEVGTGTIDFPSILKAAPASGIWAFSIGQDETEGDPLESLQKSYNYLKTL